MNFQIAVHLLASERSETAIESFAPEIESFATRIENFVLGIESSGIGSSGLASFARAAVIAV